MSQIRPEQCTKIKYVVQEDTDDGGVWNWWLMGTKEFRNPGQRESDLFPISRPVHSSMWGFIVGAPGQEYENQGHTYKREDAIKYAEINANLCISYARWKKELVTRSLREATAKEFDV